MGFKNNKRAKTPSETVFGLKTNNRAWIDI